MSKLDQCEATETYERKSIYYDIPCAWFWGDDVTGRAIEAVIAELKDKYRGKWIFTHDEPINRDNHGNYIDVRRHYFVDVLVRQEGGLDG